MRKLSFLWILLVPFFLSLSPAPVRAETALLDYQTGLALYQKCKYEKALAYFQWAQDVDFNFWPAYQMAGYCYFYLRERDSALDSFEESLRLHPANASLRKFYNSLKTGKTNVLLQPIMVDSKPASMTPPISLGLN